MKGPTDPKYINATDEGKIRYFFSWVAEAALEQGTYVPSQRETDEMVRETLLEWERIKPINPSSTIDDFINSLSQFLFSIYLLKRSIQVAQRDELIFDRVNFDSNSFSNN